MSSYRFGSVQFSKWQWALIIGTPFAVGLGLYVYKRSSGIDKLEENKTENDHKGKGSKGLTKQSSSIDSNTTVEKSNKEAIKKEMTPLLEATEFKNQGNTCYRNGKFDEAIKFYDQAIEICPSDNPIDLAIFYQNRAAAYEMLKKWSSVKEDCTLSLEQNPRYAKAYFRRAKAYEATNDYAKCLDDVTAACILESFLNTNTIMFADRILKIAGKEAYDTYIPNHKPVLPSKHFIRTYFQSFVDDPVQNMPLPQSALSEPARGFLRAKLALKEEKFDDIIAACTEEIETSEAESEYKTEALLLRGTVYLISSSNDEAKQDFDAVINNENADVNLRASALTKRASFYFQQEKREEAIADFEASLKLKPQCPDTYQQRAQIYLMFDQMDMALQDFNEAIRLAPNNILALVQKYYAEYRVAMIQQDQTRLFVMMNEFKNLIEKFPDCSDCFSLMGQVLTDQMQYPQADEMYQKAVKMAPENSILHVHRSILILQWTGDVERAVSLLDKALEIDSKCGLALETLGTIEVQRANLIRGIELFSEAVKYAKSKTEMIHLFSLQLAAQAQINVMNKLQIDVSALTGAQGLSGQKNSNS